MWRTAHENRTAIALAGILGMTGPNCVEFVANGGFEIPDIANNSFLSIAPGGEPAGFEWQVVSGDVDIVDNFAGTSAFEGDQFLDLTGSVPGQIQQDLATTPGAMYELTFAYANNFVSNSDGEGLIEVLDGKTQEELLSTTVFHDTSVPGDIDWTLFGETFTASGSSVTLRITDLMGVNNGGLFLDAISVRLALFCPNDLSGDDEVGVDDLLIVLGTWGTPDGDLTCDGQTDVSDLLALLGDWGPC